MASISWSVVGMSVTEAERAQAIAAGEAEAARLMGQLPPEFLPVAIPTQSQHPSAINPAFNVFASGLGQNVGVHRVEPWGVIPIGTSNLVDAYQQGYRYLDGKWINTALGTMPAPIGIPTATTVLTASTQSLSSLVPPSTCHSQAVPCKASE